ncbi:hypothetical protein [Dokdonia sinensis]|nr:hypothetical protein [Dokdonia sinensis]
MGLVKKENGCYDFVEITLSRKRTLNLGGREGVGNFRRLPR